MYCDQPNLLTRDPGGGVNEEIPHRWAKQPKKIILLFCPPVGYFFIYPTTWISCQKTRLVQYTHACTVVVVDSHIQRIVLATEETTATQQVSPRPIKCQSRLWSQRGTKVNGSHHGDNPLLRPTGIQIATKSYAALQAMAPTNIKTVHQTSLLHIESNLDRLGRLPTTTVTNRVF